MPEVAGEAGILVNPLEVKDIARGIIEVIRDKEIREALRKKGFEQVKKFSWEKAARETLKLYEKAVKEKKI
jgi:glycosyltransferase involved in cell wall biosynthesis